MAWRQAITPFINMNTLPIRSEIYNPAIIFGVRDTDLKYVGIISILAMIIPVIFDWFIGPIPITVLTTPFALGGSVLFFNWARVGKRNRFLEYKIKSWQQINVYRKWRARDMKNAIYLVNK